MFLSVSNCSFNVDRSHVPSPPGRGEKVAEGRMRD